MEAIVKTVLMDSGLLLLRLLLLIGISSILNIAAGISQQINPIPCDSLLRHYGSIGQATYHITYIDSCWTMGKETRDSILLGDTYHLKGLASFQINKDSAFHYFVSAFNLRKSRTDISTIETSRSGFNAGRVAELDGKSDNAFKYFQEVANLDHKNEFSFRANQKLAMFYSESGDFPRAEMFMSKAISQKEFVGSGQKFVLYLCKAVMLSEEGSEESASKILSDTSAAFAEMENIKANSLDKSRYYNYISNAQLLTGNLRKAKEGYLTGLRWAQTSIDSADIYNNLGIVYAKENEMDMSVLFLTKALKIYKAFGQNTSIGNVYSLLAEQQIVQNNLWEAQEFAELALKHLALADSLLSQVFSRFNSHELIADIHEDMARIAFKRFQANPDQNHLEDAIAHLIIADDAIDIIRKPMAFERGHLKWRALAKGVYELALDVAIAADSVELAFHWMERGKSLVLLESIHKSKTIEGLTRAMRDEYFDLQDKVYGIQAVILRIESQANESIGLSILQDSLLNTLQAIESFEIILEKEYPGTQQLYFKKLNVHYEQLISTLSDNESVLSYFYGRDSLVGLHLGGGHYELKKLASNEEMHDKVARYKGLMSQYPSAIGWSDDRYAIYKDSLGRSLYELGNTLIQPFKDLRHHVKILPEGDLFNVAFDILLDSEPKPNTNFSDWPYLLSDYCFSYDHSAANWLRSEELDNRDHTITLLSPSFENSTYAPLANVHNLVNAIDGYHSTILMGAEATKANYMNIGAPGILHLATHAVIDDDNSQSSFLLLNDENLAIDSMLLIEIYQSRLDGAFVILNACETNRGQLLPGEGIQNFTRAFTHAGASGMITSLWPVNEYVSSELMVGFYHHLSQEMRKDKSLQLAKQEYLSKATSDREGHPYLWASMIHFGQTKKTTLSPKRSLWWKLGGGLTLIGIIVLLVRRTRRS